MHKEFCRGTLYTVQHSAQSLALKHKGKVFPKPLGLVFLPYNLLFLCLFSVVQQRGEKKPKQNKTQNQQQKTTNKTSFLIRNWFQHRHLAPYGIYPYTTAFGSVWSQNSTVSSSIPPLFPSPDPSGTSISFLLCPNPSSCGSYLFIASGCIYQPAHIQAGACSRMYRGQQGLCSRTSVKRGDPGQRDRVIVGGARICLRDRRTYRNSPWGQKSVGTALASQFEMVWRKTCKIFSHCPWGFPTLLTSPVSYSQLKPLHDVIWMP